MTVFLAQSAPGGGTHDRRRGSGQTDKQGLAEGARGDSVCLGERENRWHRQTGTLCQGALPAPISMCHSLPIMSSLCLPFVSRPPGFVPDGRPEISLFVGVCLCQPCCLHPCMRAGPACRNSLARGLHSVSLLGWVVGWWWTCVSPSPLTPLQTHDFRCLLFLPINEKLQKNTKTQELGKS